MPIRYIHEHDDWPKFYWDDSRVIGALSEVRHLQGRLLGRMEALGLSLRTEAALQTMTQDVVKTSEIEGERLDADLVRSSIVRKMGVDVGGLIVKDRNVDGIVDVLFDATHHYEAPLTEERLFGWHAALFPTGRSGMQRIQVGKWRTEASGPMQVVSGPYGRERIHFEAPEHHRLRFEVERFLAWFNSHEGTDPVLKAAIAHFWFVTIHPFDDGNGRIARAIADLALARSESCSLRFYSMSSQIQRQRSDYYDILETCQKGTPEITGWISWFLRELRMAIIASETTLERVLNKARFWEAHRTWPFNERQRQMLNRLLDGFCGKLTSSQWALLTKCSQDTALRDIDDLLNRNILARESAGGRSTSYRLAFPPLVESTP